jgi:2-oxoglutarate dehydrogenase E1 component
MAHRTTLEEERPAKTQKAAKKPATGDSSKAGNREERERIFDAFRRWGYLAATLDPLGLLESLKHPDLEGLIGEAAEEARRIYCGTVGADFMHLQEPERRRWISERLEAPSSQVDQHEIL